MWQLKNTVKPFGIRQVIKGKIYGVLTKQLKNQHLLWRCGFGVNAAQAGGLNNTAAKSLYTAMQQKCAIAPAPLTVAENVYAGIFKQAKSVGDMQNMKDNISAEKKKEMRIQSREDLKKLTLQWLDAMVNSDAQLTEKMALFWHGHFASRIVNIYYQQLLLNDIRQNALGNFGDLLKAVSKSASMLQFLNNQQNRKEHPNENFAREVMELFTLGRGNYTEADVKEAARAFTGWGFSMDGQFQFRPFAHDNGSKTFLGKTGNFNGDDILNILLQQKQTAVFITKKICRYFVNEQLDDAHIQWLAGRFYQSNYDIKGLMNDIFTADWFYDDKNIAQKIKSPVELIVGIRRLLPMQISNPEIQLLFQRALGQLLFYPPNVAGWPGGKAWIDSSSLMLRLRLPQLIEDNSDFAIKPKADDDQQMGMRETFAKARGDAKKGFAVEAQINWLAYTNIFAAVPREQLYSNIEALVLQTKPGSVNKAAVLVTANNTSREEYIKTVTIALMSTPEYQLC